ncbi:MAG: maleylpyruvate isomerase N-terminal domain-containing protein [Streptosporangiaceae bacterium]
MDSTKTIDATDVIAGADCVRRTLGRAAERDWSAAQVPHLSWTVAQTVAHTAEAVLWCGVDLSAAGAEIRALRLRVDSEAAPDELLRTIGGVAQTLAYVVRAAPPGARGFDPDGPTDASGFAAMGCDELLIHGWDAGRGLGVELQPDERPPCPGSRDRGGGGGTSPRWPTGPARHQPPDIRRSGVARPSTHTPATRKSCAIGTH